MSATELLCGRCKGPGYRVPSTGAVACVERCESAPEHVDDGPLEILVTPHYYGLTNQAERALCAAPEVYARCEELVRVVTTVDGRPKVLPMGKATLFDRLTDVAEWGRRVQTKEGWVTRPCLPPRQVVDALWARARWPRLRELRGVTDAPTLRPDGTVLQEAGYDRATGLLYDPLHDYEEVPDVPTKPQAQKALMDIEGVLVDFPFVADCDRLAAVAAICTLLARPAIDGPVPLVAVRAPSPGEGKSLLVDVISLIALGESAPRMVLDPDPREQRKELVSLGREGARMALVDNVDRPLGSDVLAAALTANWIKGRILGESKMWEGPPPMLFATGCNLVVQGDLGRRVLPIDLSSGLERPEERTGFRHPDVKGHVMQHRPRLLTAALTILRWFVAEGSPPADMPAWGSYEAWSGVVRAALLYLTGVDPAAGRERVVQSGDPQREADELALEQWYERLGCEPVTVRDLVSRARDYEPLRDALAGLHQHLEPTRLTRQTRTLGQALLRLQGRVIGGLRLMRGRKTKAGRMWAVEEVTRGQ